MPSLGLPPGSVLPRYGSDCVSSVPSTVMRLLGAKPVGPELPARLLGNLELSGVENVVLLVADGFGMNEWRRQRIPGLARDFARGGQVSEITTVFPSTTAAGLTTLATGLTPQEHALPEWFVYLKEVNSVVATLPFSFVGDRARETLRGAMRPAALFRGTPIFRLLKADGVKTYSFTSRALANTTYTRLVHGSSEMLPYSSSSDMVVSLRKAVESARGPALFYVYWSHVDSVEHHFGPGTEESELEAASISHLLHAGFLRRLARRAARRTLLVMTADHGQLPVDLKGAYYLNRLPKLTGMFRSVGGKRITPAGNGRDVFLYLEEDKVDDALELLRRRLAGRATVLKTEDAIRAGLFGLNVPSRKFRERVGDVLVLPHGNGIVWYRKERGYEMDLRGHHGGLTSDEMTVPLALGRVSDISA